MSRMRKKLAKPKKSEGSWAPISQSVFVLKIKIEQALPSCSLEGFCPPPGELRKHPGESREQRAGAGVGAGHGHGAATVATDVKKMATS